MPPAQLRATRLFRPGVREDRPNVELAGSQSGTEYARKKSASVNTGLVPSASTTIVVTWYRATKSSSCWRITSGRPADISDLAGWFKVAGMASAGNGKGPRPQRQRVLSGQSPQHEEGRQRGQSPTAEGAQRSPPGR
jgi:hypothetical protein